MQKCKHCRAENTIESNGLCHACGKNQADEKTSYCKFEYKEAKELLRTAKPRQVNGVHSFGSPNHTETRWEINGKPWVENESHLESPEDDYSLVQVNE